ncbi:MAG: response regulator [Chitinophagales bacterium]|nr:response regulator [Chitinophagales bacterium]
MATNKTVLIIDDEQEICMLLATIVKKNSLNPVYVHSISDAVLIVEKFRPILTFLDINLPDGNGLDLLGTLTSQYPKMKVVIISAFDGFRERAINIGAHGFLSKPFTQKSVADLLIANETA